MNVKAKILIVDDEQINLDFFDVMLSKLGFEVERAEDGEEALDKVRSFCPDLIILDNIMPKLSGWEVTKILKNDDDFLEFRGIPIIMFSALDDVKDKIEGFELGVEDYITKPFNFSEVLARIKAVLRHKDLSDQVVQRERRIALIESLNKSMVFFTKHLRQPVLDLISRANSIDRADAKAIAEFVSRVKDESESTLAALDGLDEEIKELQTKDTLLKKGELTLEDLEEKYKKHFHTLRDKQESFNGADA